MAIVREKIAKDAQRTFAPDDIEASFGKPCLDAFKRLQAANAAANEARKALHATVATKLGAIPAGKVLVVKANFGKLWMALVDGETKSAQPKASLSDWLKAQVTA